MYDIECATLNTLFIVCRGQPKVSFKQNFFTIKIKFYIPSSLPYELQCTPIHGFLRDVLPLPEIAQFGLEVYYNGDRAMTEFKIKCYKSTGHGWNYIGMYTPDFLIIQRRDGKIHKALIVETKGKIYANEIGRAHV